MNILEKIAERTKERIETQKKELPLAELQRLVGADSISPCFESALRQNTSDVSPGGESRQFDIAFICEVKKASPSKGIIAHYFDPVAIAREYQTAGAAAISVLTEPFYFHGHDDYLRAIADGVAIPLLRKDFTVDEYMIYHAKLLGASAVLLICSILDDNQLAEYIEISHGIGLSALVEVHNEHEVEMALSAGARVIGVNNRDLKTFEIDMNLSKHLRKFVPQDIIFVAESGIHTPQDVQSVREMGANAALIGESIMKSDDKAGMIAWLRG